MDVLQFEDVFEFCDMVETVYDDLITEDEYNNLTIVAKGADVEAIVSTLIEKGFDVVNDDYYIGCYSDPLLSSDEFYVSLLEEKIYIETVIDEDGDYVADSCNVAYIMSDCNSKIIKYIECPEMYEVQFDDINEEYLVKPQCQCKEKYMINGMEVDKDTYNSEKKEIYKRFNQFDDAFMDAIRNALLLRCSIVEGFQDLFKEMF